jgi:hypothetical protein
MLGSLARPVGVDGDPPAAKWSDRAHGSEVETTTVGKQLERE